jgi:hypothetical protein
MKGCTPSIVNAFGAGPSGLRLRHTHHGAINSIDCREDLKSIFIGNFQGTYVHPGNPWDLKGYWQK